jgi:glucans biosynthesis protein C
MSPRKKDLSIETLRGFAIIFMVAGHIIGGDESGMRLADHSGWRYFYFTFEYLRMPLFTVISGYVYSLWPVGDSKYFDFLKGKARRVLLPYIFVGSLHFVIQALVPGTNTKLPLTFIWNMFIFPYAHFWFLMSIFLIFVLVGILDTFKKMSAFNNWFLIFIIAAVVRFLVPKFEHDVFSINGFFNLLPFFLLGCGIQRFQDVFTSKVVIRSALIVFIITIAMQQYTWFAGIKLNIHEFRVLSLFVACSGITLFFFIRKNINFISKIGYYAFGIYLFHVLGTAGSRIVLLKFGLDQHFFVFTVGLIFGIGIPILIELVFEKSRILRRLFLGLK